MSISLDFGEVVRRVHKAVVEHQVPSLFDIAQLDRDPYQILVSTIISLRTKDSVTAAAARRLFDEAATPQAMAALPTERLQELIYPAGFYRNKAENIKKISTIILNEYSGRVPATQAELLKLPGVGLKTANLTLSLGFQLPYICVDIHVHRISNRIGWVRTEKPDETEGELSHVLPQKYWIEINELFVRFGQSICTPVSPWCSQCPLEASCPKLGVNRHR
ncbi:MAG: endonuclease III [Spirochaetaceae bacterium]|nr:endonuclease III [Spirochaetaceae bacterium]MCF7952373.1 endonuclease III [Spirochaetaceae bacterium]